MNRDEMVEGIIRASGISKANVNRFYDGLVVLAMKKLASDGQFVLPGLGVLRVKVRKARDGRNPQTGEKSEFRARRWSALGPTRTSRTC